MKYIMFFDDGHGISTAGKRTPMLPGSTTFMHENEFNRAVVTLLLLFAQATDGVTSFLTAPTDYDTSLSERTNYANKELEIIQTKYGKENVKAIYLSVHANAYKGVWGTWGGEEIYYYPSSTEGEKLAKAIYKEMQKGSDLRNRGVKPRSLHMTKYPHMPSVLSESAFMDNLEEAKLLMSWDFRLECATEMFTGMCNYLEITPNIPDIFNKEKATTSDCAETERALNGCISSLGAIKYQISEAITKYRKD